MRGTGLQIPWRAMHARGLFLRAGVLRSPTGRLGAVLLAATAALTLSAFSLPDSEPGQDVEISQLLAYERERLQRDTTGGQRPYLPEPDGHFSTASPPASVARGELVSRSVRWADRDLPYLIPDTALPFRYHVDQALAQRFGLETVIEAMRQWDDIPGSRWATEFGSVVQHPDSHPRRDGHSVVYLHEDCPPGYLGGASWNMAPGPGRIDLRYGNAALYGTQIDIAICTTVETTEQLHGVVAHEVGHTMGMAHLCEPGEVCWTATEHDADHDHRCRPMYHLFGPCRSELTDLDYDAARHLYPTIQRLWGPDVAATAARASYATTWSQTAETVILARWGGRLAWPLLGATLTGIVDGPLLLAEPDDNRCVTGPAAEELARAGSRSTRVLLVGQWPDVCETRFERWGLDSERLDAGAHIPNEPAHSRAARAAVATSTFLVEETGTTPDSVVLAVVDNEGGRDVALDAVTAAAAAGRSRLPLLLSHPAHLSDPTRQWLQHHLDVRRVHVIAGAAGEGLLAELRELGLTVVYTEGLDAVERAAATAAKGTPLGTIAQSRVILAPTDALGEAVVAASLASRLEASLLFTPDETHPSVILWLARHHPSGGYLVAAPETVPYPTQWRYATQVPSGDPAPSRVDAPRGLFDFRLGD